jgi:murein L,D-transpeptidase YafK
MMLLLGIVATLSFAGPRDTMSVASKRTTPTISRAPVTGIRSAVVADSIVVEKGKRLMTLYQAGFAVRKYKIALGKQPLGDKIRKGDNRTPEGTFFIDYKNASSLYHKALHISYPDAFHAQRARSLGVSPGNDVMIHGLPPEYAKMGAAHSQWDWTEGCIAVTDKEIEEIYSAIPKGAIIHIKP